MQANAVMNLALEEMAVSIEEYNDYTTELFTEINIARNGILSPTLIKPETLIQGLREVYQQNLYVNTLLPPHINIHCFIIQSMIFSSCPSKTGLRIMTKYPIAHADPHEIIKLRALPFESRVNVLKLLEITPTYILMSKGDSK